MPTSGGPYSWMLLRLALVAPALGCRPHSRGGGQGMVTQDAPPAINKHLRLSSVFRICASARRAMNPLL